MNHPAGEAARLAVVAVFIGCVFASIDVHADGDDYFQPSNAPLDHQLIFVGVVKDEAGGYLQGALVRWHATGTASVDGEEYTSTAGSWTDLLGRFRSVDVARVLAIEGVRLDPTRVDVTVEKSGYEVIRRIKRSRPRQRMGLQEVDFIMRKAEATREDVAR